MKVKSGKIISLMYMEFGNLLMEFDCNEDAARFLVRALREFEKAGDTHGVRRALQSLGKILVRRGDFRLAETFFSYCLDLREPEDPGYDLFPLLGLADLYRMGGRYAEAEKAAEEIRLKLHNNEGMKPYYYAALSGIYMETGRYRQAVELINRAREEDIPETNGEIWIELQARLGWCYFNLGETEKANECFSEALALAEDKGSSYRESSIHSLFSKMKEATGDLEGALSHAELAVDKAVSAQSELCMSLAAEAMGRGMCGADRRREGSEYLKYSLMVARRMRHSGDVCTALLDLAGTYLEAGRYEEAMTYAYRLLFYADAWLAHHRKEALLILAKVYSHQGLAGEAAAILKPVMAWAEEAGVPGLAAEAKRLYDLNTSG